MNKKHKFGLLKEELMDYVPKKAIDALLKRIWLDLDLPRPYSSETKRPNTPEEVRLVSFKREDIDAWEKKLIEWLRFEYTTDQSWEEQKKFEARMREAIDDTKLTSEAKVIVLNLLHQGILWGWRKEVEKALEAE